MNLAKNKDNMQLAPVIKWVGGKRQLLPRLMEYKPQNFKKYFEPFLGGGAMLFSLAPEKAIINDNNLELINMYSVIKAAPEKLVACLEEHQENNSKEYYLYIRGLDRDGTIKTMTDVQRAARLIYMLKVDFNGLYRVNKKGQFNVPYGRYKNPKIADASRIYAMSSYFNNNDVLILGGDFENAVKSATKGDLVYFDPPYIPLNDTSNFTSYTKEGFGLAEQKRLRDLFFNLSDKGVHVMLSNSDTKLTRELYTGAKIHSVSAKRAINSNAKKRGSVSEVIITNYEV